MSTATKQLDSARAPRVPTDRPREARSKRWAFVDIEIESGVSEAAGALAVELAITRDAVWLGSWLILLARWSGQESAAVLLRDGSSREGRLVHTAMHHPLTFAQTVARADVLMRETAAGSASVDADDASAQTSFEIAGDDDGRSTVSIRGVSETELALTIDVAIEHATARIDFRADLFERGTVQRMLRHYRRLLQHGLAAPQTPIAVLPLISEEEQIRLLIDLNRTECVLPDRLRVHELFEQIAQRVPDAVAVVHQRAETTYAALNQQANQLARHLRELGVGPDAVVGICLERSPRLIVGMLAALKAGGAYLPLDPSLPSERLAFMIEDASAAVVLTEKALLERMPGSAARRTVCVDHESRRIAQHDARNLESTGNPEHLAYVIYTSGSSGKPKGVMISHRSAVNFLASMQRIPGLAAHDRLLATTTIAFDPALHELMLPLITGARVVLASSAERVDPWRLCEMLDEFAITMMAATPSAWSQLIAVGWRGSPRLRALVGGEALAPALARGLLERCREVWNMYGPTETTVAATCWQVSDPEDGIFIGRPIANTRCFVLDDQLQLCPLGVYGELYIGGVGLARGYLNRPELTAAKFVADPWSPSTPLYATGDRARWSAAGQLEFSGRIDNQVKLRGFRIEIGEIEAELNTCAGVQGSAVIIREDRPGDQRLVAYVVGEVPSAAELKRHLARKLPGYMVPSAIVTLDALPLTANRKLDRDALPLPVQHTADPEMSPGAADMNALQHSLAEEWRSALGVHAVGLDDDFFDLGGHSLLALELLARISKRFGQRLTLASLLAAPTVRAQSELLRSGLAAAGVCSIVPIHASGARPRLFFASGWGGPTLSLRALAAALGPEQPLYLLDYVGPQAQCAPPPTIERIASELITEMRGLQANGPYHLIGYSLGAKVVYEMARQLHADGEVVEKLILIDDYAPGHPTLPPFFVRALLHLRQALKLGPLRMWPYLMKYAFRLRRFVVDVRPKLYEGLNEQHSSPLISDLTQGALMIYHASQRYQLEPYSGRMLVITAEDKSEFGIGAFDPDPTNGWRQWAAETRFVGSLPCAHSRVLDLEQAPRLAELINACM